MINKGPEELKKKQMKAQYWNEKYTTESMAE